MNTKLILSEYFSKKAASNQWFYPFHILIAIRNGCSSFITDASGNATQHLQYLPFGESFVDQRNSSFDSRYKFSAKEKDDETGYSYFGARYYDSDISVWLSVDPMSDKFPDLSPYNYSFNNPTNFVDLFGLEPDPPPGAWVYKKGQKPQWEPLVTCPDYAQRIGFIYIGKTVSYTDDKGVMWHGNDQGVKGYAKELSGAEVKAKRNKSIDNSTSTPPKLDNISTNNTNSKSPFNIAVTTEVVPTIYGNYFDLSISSDFMLQINPKAHGQINLNRIGNYESTTLYMGTSTATIGPNEISTSIGPLSTGFKNQQFVFGVTLPTSYTQSYTMEFSFTPKQALKTGIVIVSVVALKGQGAPFLNPILRSF